MLATPSYLLPCRGKINWMELIVDVKYIKFVFSSHSGYQIFTKCTSLKCVNFYWVRTQDYVGMDQCVSTCFRYALPHDFCWLMEYDGSSRSWLLGWTKWYLTCSKRCLQRHLIFCLAEEKQFGWKRELLHIGYFINYIL